MKKTRIVLCGLVVAGLLVALNWPENNQELIPPPGAQPGDKIVNSKTGETNIVLKATTVVDGENQDTLELAPLGGRSIERKPLEPGATKRLHDDPVVELSVFEASGKAEHGKNGLLTRGTYYYMTTVRTRSEVMKKECDDGIIRVVEKRTFLQARDILSLSELDVELDLSTLPVDTVKTWANHACTLGEALAGCACRPEVALTLAGVHVVVEAAFTALEAVDGRSLRALLGDFGKEPPVKMEEWLRQRLENVASTARSVHGALQSIEGQTYIITYTQDAEGKPLKVDFRREDDQPITGTEWEILRAANAFLDRDIVPDGYMSCNVGDCWSVRADEIQKFFGLSKVGKTVGTIWVEREKDQPDGNWTLRIHPAKIAFRGDGGSGTLSVTNGIGLVDAERRSVKSIQVSATGDMGLLDKKRHCLFFEFVQSTKGEAKMRFTLSSEPDGE